MALLSFLPSLLPPSVCRVPGEEGVGRQSLRHHPLAGLDQVVAVELLEHATGTLHLLRGKAGNISQRGNKGCQIIEP